VWYNQGVQVEVRMSATDFCALYVASVSFGDGLIASGLKVRRRGIKSLYIVIG